MAEAEAVECGGKSLKLLKSARNMSSGELRRNKSPGNETILGFSRRTPETPDGYQSATKRRQAPQGQSETVKCGPSSSLAGSAETGMPGIGTFSYNGSPVVTPHAIVVAAR
jgi:hypothetical protein